MTHRDDLAAVTFTLQGHALDPLTFPVGPFIADAVIAHYKANPYALLDLIRECGGPVAYIFDEGARWAKKPPANLIQRKNVEHITALARRWLEGT
jgi:hypothetical protein